jgi:transcription termination factor Rho
LAPREKSTTDEIPFGAMERPDTARPSRGEGGAGTGETETGERSGKTRRGGRRRRRRRTEGPEAEAAGGEATANRGQGRDQGAATEKTSPPRGDEGSGEASGKRRRRRRGRRGGAEGQPRSAEGGEGESEARGEARGEGRAPTTASGMFVAEKGGFGTLRSLERQWIPSKQDVFVPQRLVQKYKLHDGSIVEGRISKGKKYRFQLEDVHKVDGEAPRHWNNLKAFKSLTTIDPDFHYEVGDVTDDVSMRVLDILAPVGRGQRGLITAPPRTGKTTLLRQFARGIEVGYPEVHLMVLLVDERPEEATDWRRSTGGQVFVSTSDETPKNHVRLAEAVWKRCQRLVELGQDVVLIIDSITRLARAYNNHSGGTGRTMSGGLDSRAMERPRQIFGSARNTERAGSLTILATALIETGSRMDQLIFEEFKGTGNMELVLNRKLADRRIFPAIDIEKSGTRKEEKIISSRRLKRINTLRRVLLRMNFIEAMELLSEKLLDVEKTDDFLQRFEVDPEA